MKTFLRYLSISGQVNQGCKQIKGEQLGYLIVLRWKSFVFSFGLLQWDFTSYILTAPGTEILSRFDSHKTITMPHL